MLNNIFIPKKIKVGYNNREDTYSGKLAYITYIDEKGKLRKEKSWNSWRDKGLNEDNFENEPTSGFVLNKKAGGTSWGWNPRQTYSRVYDPRGFEFEITIPNLLYILENCNSIKGKGLEGEFVYGWSGKELLLIPVDAPDYKDHVAFSKGIYGDRIKVKDMIPGATYKFSNGKVYVFLGRFDEYRNNRFLQGELGYKKAFFFFDIKYLDYKDWWKGKEGLNNFFGIKIYKSLPKIVQCIDENSHHNYSKMMDWLARDSRYVSPKIYKMEKEYYASYNEFKKEIISKIKGNCLWIDFDFICDLDNTIKHVSFRSDENIGYVQDRKKIEDTIDNLRFSSSNFYRNSRFSIDYIFKSHKPIKSLKKIKRSNDYGAE